eukprot:TRINITY_DN7046_c0_g2_i1.p1 TRINITY_DN7046_c0_g2~~TRINITY_DN7046_c0_g2_i1.p1  ORF type:complete len:578 (+),score=98.63 TRINITY_DN7046_c0_g2_i1:75-1736(+)
MALACSDENSNVLNTNIANEKDELATKKVVSDPDRLQHLAEPRVATKLIPSTAELERMYIEGKRRELQNSRRRNEDACRNAISNPQVMRKSGSKITVPREFNLSRSNRGSRCNTPSRSVCSESDMELDSVGTGKEWQGSSSRRGRSSSRPRSAVAGPGTPMKPALTVPKGPNLLTSWRPRSISRSRAEAMQEHDMAMTPQAWSQSLRRAAGRNSSRSSSRGSSRQGSAQPSPARSNMSIRSARSTRSTRSSRKPPQFNAPVFNAEASTPLRCSSRGRGRSSLVTPSPARSAMSSCSSQRSCSDMSLASVNSRFSRLSMSSTSILARCPGLSTEDLKQLQAEAGRQELSELMAHNAKAYKQAIHCPDMRRGHHSLELTVPDEFTLSVSNRTDHSYHSARSAAPSGTGGSKVERWTKSLRQPSESPSRAAWQLGKLTAPKAPNLATSSRQRSTSVSSRHSSSGKRSMSCKSLPPREQEAVKKHIERTASAHQAAKLSKEDEQWIQSAAGAEARAERARSVMKAKQDQALAEEKQRLCIFRKPEDKSQSRGRAEAR